MVFGWGGLVGGAVFPHEDSRKAHRLSLNMSGWSSCGSAGCVMPEAWAWEVVIV